jgi:hypothetical protein
MTAQIKRVAFGSLAVSVVLSLFYIFACCGCKTTNDKPATPNGKVSVSTVEEDIRSHLPIGSSKADVVAFLDKRNIAHGWDQTGQVLPDGRFVIPDSHMETGLIRDVRVEGALFKTCVSIQIEFKFDETDSKLVDYSVYEIYTGP